MRAITLLVVMTALSSCSSWIETTRKTVNGEDGPRKAQKEVKWVSKAQYDDLMVKYKNLLNEYDSLKNAKSSNDPNIASEVVNQNLAESVNVFAPQHMAPAKAVENKSLSIDEASKELKLYRRSEALYGMGKVDEALSAFQVLQKSPTSQIRVRAKRYIALIYMRKEQYDLALQVLEQIIQSEAFSAVVLDALSSAIVCCQKLGLEEKREQYQSILKDVFQLG